MAERTKETLVRHVRIYGPDGASVGRLETVEVEVTWPDGKPPESGSYNDYGEWTFSRRAGDDDG